MTARKSPTIAITGASGFLGGVLIDYFHHKGWKVVALVRNKSSISSEKAEYRHYDITKPIPKSSLQNVDYLVHAAYIKFGANNANALDMNVKGAKSLLKAAKMANIKRVIFISTMSAHEDAISVYGKQKLKIEKLFLQNNHATVLRCGLIVGNGGIVSEMAHFMLTKRIVPLVDGGKQPLQIVSVYDVASVVYRVIDKSLNGTFVIATPKVYSYKSFYYSLANYLQIRVFFVPLPYKILEFIFKVFALFKIPLGVGGDNLKGLKKLRSMSSEEDLKKIGIELSNLDEALRLSKLKG